MITSAADLLAPIRRLHVAIRDEVVAACERVGPEELASVAEEEEGDTLYAVDRIGDQQLVELVEQTLAWHTPVVLIAEGLGSDGTKVLPEGTSEEEAVWRILMDPIDGTRGLMYQKRPAWVLTGVAPNRGPETSLRDIALALQTEIPLVKQHLSETVWAVQGQGVGAERYNRLTGESRGLDLRPSRARSIAHGFAMISRFFPGAREELAAIDEEIIEAALGPVKKGKAHCFEDQYVSTGGQLYELMSGHDRFVADIRPLMEPLVAKRGRALGICCHPYDLSTELIARELGVIVTDPQGRPLSARLNVTENVSWVGYANDRIRAQIEPHFRKALQRRGLLPD